jgi:hypothetical protein
MWPPWNRIHIRGAITDVAREGPDADNGAEVLCERIKLLLWKIGWKAVDVDIRYALLRVTCVGLRYTRRTGRLRVNLNSGKRMR